MATPQVAGTWALLKHAHPSGTVDELLAALQSTGVSITTNCDGYTIPIPRIQVDAAINALSGAFVVLSPNGGEDWTAGSTQNISWTTTPVSYPLTIQLYKDGSFLGKIAQGVDPSTGSYSWTVGQLASGTAPAGSGYKIRIIEKTTNTYDISDGTFSITSSGQSISVTSPNGGENWTSGFTQDITWTATGTSNPLTIQLYQNSNFIGKIAQDVDPSTGSYTWTVGELISGTAPLGTGYKIRIIVKATNTYDMSDGTFIIISSGPSITVTSPNGGENWTSGYTQDITWTATGTSNPLTIQLYQNGSFIGKIAQGVTPGSDSYVWTVGELASGTAPVGTGYKIRIIDKTTGAFDRSNGFFSIAGTEP